MKEKVLHHNIRGFVSESFLDIRFRIILCMTPYDRWFLCHQAIILLIANHFFSFSCFFCPLVSSIIQTTLIFLLYLNAVFSSSFVWAVWLVTKLTIGRIWTTFYKRFASSGHIGLLRWNNLIFIIFFCNWPH